MNSIASPDLAAQAVQYRHDLGLGGDVQRGGRLVGQEQAGPGQQGRGDHDPLQHPAGHLMRVLLEPPGPVLDAHLGEHVHRAAARLRPRHLMVGAQRLGHEVPDAPHRVDVGSRVLEDHRHLAAVPAKIRTGELADFGTAEPDRAVHLGAGRQQTADGPGGHGLARPGLADQADGLARPQRERDIPQHGASGAVHLQQHGQAGHLQQRQASCRPGGGQRAARVRVAHPRAAWACSNSRSPSTLTAITTVTMQMPAATAGSGWPSRRPSWFSEIMTPQLAVGGCTPRPR